MAFQRLLSKVRAGFWNSAVSSTVAGGLVAAGTTNADALQLDATADINTLVTVAASTGVKLPAPTGNGDAVVVFNRGANAVLVYPQAGGQINALTATTGGFSVAAGGRAVFVCHNGTDWLAVLSA